MVQLIFKPIDDEWNSGEEIPVILVDGDENKNSRVDEDLDLNNPAVTLIPSLVTGDPFTLGEGSNSTLALYANVTNYSVAGADLWFGVNASSTLLRVHSVNTATISIDSFSEIGRINSTGTAGTSLNGANAIIIDFQTTMGELRSTIGDTSITSGLHGLNLLNLDVRSFNNTGTFNVYLLNSTTDIISSNNVADDTVGSLLLASGVSPQSLTSLNATTINNQLFDKIIDSDGGAADSNNVGILIQHVGDTTNIVEDADAIDPIVVDFFSFGFTNDGLNGGDRSC